MNYYKRSISLFILLSSFLLALFFSINLSNNKIDKNMIDDISINLESNNNYDLIDNYKDIKNGLFSTNENLSIKIIVKSNCYVKIEFTNNTDSIYYLEKCEINWVKTSSKSSMGFDTVDEAEEYLENNKKSKNINLNLSPNTSKTVTIFNSAESYKSQPNFVITYVDYVTGESYTDIISTDSNANKFDYPSFVAFFINYQLWIAIGLISLIVLIIFLKVMKRIRRNKRLKKLEELDYMYDNDNVQNNIDNENDLSLDENNSDMIDSNDEILDHNNDISDTHHEILEHNNEYNNNYGELNDNKVYKNTAKYVVFGLFFFILFMVLLLVQKFGPERPIGNDFLGKINNLVNYKDNHSVDVVSDLMLYGSFIFVLIGVIVGIFELIKKKLSRFIVAFGIFVVISVVLWILLDKVMTVSLRPLEDENSFPSTHVFVFTFFSLSGLTLLYDHVFKKSQTFKSLLYFIVIIAIIAMPVLRVIAGKHYITDTIGGLLLGLSLYCLTVGFGFKNERRNLIKTLIIFFSLVIALGIGIIIFFNATSAGKTAWNNWQASIQEANEKSEYEKRKKVEETCRSMIASYQQDVMTYEAFKDNEDEYYRSIAMEARTRANQTAKEYNEYIEKNKDVLKEDWPADISDCLIYIE